MPRTMDRTEWLRVRKDFLTATDMARIVSGRFGGLFQVVAEKLYCLRPAPWDDEWLTLGKAVEPLIIDWIRREAGLFTNPPMGLAQAKAVHSNGFISATLDWLDTRGRFLIEAKSHGLGGFASDHWGEPGTDDVPLYTATQVAVQRACVPTVDRCLVGCWLPSGKRWYELTVDAEREAALVGLAEYVRSTYMLPRLMPEPDDSITEASYAALRRITPEPGKTVPIGAALLDQLEAVRNACAFMDQQRRRIEATVVVALGDAECGECPDGRKVERPTIRVNAGTDNERSYSPLKLRRAPYYGAGRKVTREIHDE